MLNRLINENILATRIKILAARIPYFFTIIFLGKKPRIITRGGIKYEADLSEGIDFSLFLFGKYQEHVTKNSIVKIPKDAVIIDVGANMGTMSLQFAKIATEGKVYSFEPTHYSIARLKRNLELNPDLASRIEVIQSFVSSSITQNADIKAFASWKVSGEKTEGMHPLHMGVAKSTEGVGSTTLDEFAKSRNLAKIDYIKIDTDGHEYEVLEGAKETIRRYRPYVIFEAGMYAMAEKNIDFSFYLQFFKEYNYSLYDSIKEVELDGSNFAKYIPEKGTIDIIARPL